MGSMMYPPSPFFLYGWDRAQHPFLVRAPYQFQWQRGRRWHPIPLEPVGDGWHLVPADGIVHGRYYWFGEDISGIMRTPSAEMKAIPGMPFDDGIPVFIARDGTDVVPL